MVSCARARGSHPDAHVDTWGALVLIIRGCQVLDATQIDQPCVCGAQQAEQHTLSAPYTWWEAGNRTHGRAATAQARNTPHTHKDSSPTCFCGMPNRLRPQSVQLRQPLCCVVAVLRGVPHLQWLCLTGCCCAAADTVQQEPKGVRLGHLGKQLGAVLPELDLRRYPNTQHMHVQETGRLPRSHTATRLRTRPSPLHSPARCAAPARPPAPRAAWCLPAWKKCRAPRPQGSSHQPA